MIERVETPEIENVSGSGLGQPDGQIVLRSPTSCRGLRDGLEIEVGWEEAGESLDVPATERTPPLKTEIARNGNTLVRWRSRPREAAVLKLTGDQGRLRQSSLDGSPATAFLSNGAVGDKDEPTPRNLGYFLEQIRSTRSSERSNSFGADKKRAIRIPSPSMLLDRRRSSIERNDCRSASNASEAGGHVLWALDDEVVDSTGGRLGEAWTTMTDDERCRRFRGSVRTRRFARANRFLERFVSLALGFALQRFHQDSLLSIVASISRRRRLGTTLAMFRPTDLRGGGPRRAGGASCGDDGRLASGSRVSSRCRASLFPS